jgi:hypothetical protein
MVTVEPWVPRIRETKAFAKNQAIPKKTTITTIFAILLIIDYLVSPCVPFRDSLWTLIPSQFDGSLPQAPLAAEHSRQVMHQDQSA